MGTSQASKAATHQQIVQVAAKRFREKGLEGIGIADIMTEAGVTIGGFYKHFDSRDQLVREALLSAFSNYNLLGQGPDVMQEVEKYLSVQHRDSAGTGCATGALLGEVVHASPSVRKVYTSQIKKTVSAIASSLSERGTDNNRADALLLMCALLGAINLARAVDEPALSREVLGVGSRLAELLSGSALRKDRRKRVSAKRVVGTKRVPGAK